MSPAAESSMWGSFWPALIMSAFWATVGWKAREVTTDPADAVAPVEASPEQVKQIWRMCTLVADVVIYETEYMCRSHRECPDELLECEDQMYACWEATDDTCDLRIDGLLDDMLWNFGDRQFDEYENGSTGAEP